MSCTRQHTTLKGLIYVLFCVSIVFGVRKTHKVTRMLLRPLLWVACVYVAYLWKIPEISLGISRILVFEFKNIDNLFESIFMYNCFILISNLHVIVSEFYDLDVGTVKSIEIQPKRLPIAPFRRAGWTLKQVT